MVRPNWALNCGEQCANNHACASVRQNNHPNILICEPTESFVYRKHVVPLYRVRQMSSQNPGLSRAVAEVTQPFGSPPSGDVLRSLQVGSCDVTLALTHTRTRAYTRVTHTRTRSHRNTCKTRRALTMCTRPSCCVRGRSPSGVCPFERAPCTQASAPSALLFP